jgi:hypothetical protein
MLSGLPLTFNNHGNGVLPETFDTHPALSDHFDLLAYDFDDNGDEVISSRGLPLPYP